AGAFAATASSINPRARWLLLSTSVANMLTLGRSAGISVRFSHAPLQYRKKSSPGFTAGSMFPTTTPCDSSAACSPHAGCQPIVSRHVPAASQTPLLTTRTAFSETLICPLYLFWSNPDPPDTHLHSLKRQNPRKGSTQTPQISLGTIQISQAPGS